MRSIGPSLPG
uniref:Uncharacterized protein n=1 Tax=Anguilla anguilla TaxID=7936 RepID=A0A0E9SQF8_ANGAN